MSKWPSQSLASAIQCRKEFIQIDDLATYKRCRVQLHAQGIVLRDSVPGAEIKTKKQQVCKAGDFLVAEIDAKVGGFGIVPNELDQAIVSSHYFLFEINEKVLNRRFLDFYIRTPGFREQVAAQGSTNYAAIRPIDVLGYNIPLPPLAEQRRIVARIESLAARIGEACGLRQETIVEAETLVNAQLRGISQSLEQKYGTSRIETFIAQAGYGSSEMCSRERDEGAVPVLRIPNVASERIDLNDLKFAHLSKGVHKSLLLTNGDILVVRTNGSKDLIGRCAVVDELPEPMAFASYLIRLQFDHCRILPTYAQRILQHLRVSGQLIDFARTTAGQYNVSLGRLRSAEIPVPPLPEQRAIVDKIDILQAKIGVLKKLQTETAAELAALLPSILDKAFKGDL